MSYTVTNTFATQSGNVPASQLDTNFTNVLSGVNNAYLVGTLAARPAPDGIGNGRYYFATDASGGTLYRDNGTAWVQVASAAGGGIAIAAAGGTVNAITATYAANITLTDQTLCAFVSAGANTSTTPTFAPNALTAHTITARGGGALQAGDIGAAGFVALVEYNLSNTRWELLNPAIGITKAPKVGSFARDLTAASGNVSITGVGFKPRAVAFLMAVSSTSAASWGFDDGTTAAMIEARSAASWTWFPSTGASIFVDVSAGNTQQALIASMDTDGFTLTWTKIGSPSGTATVHYLALP